MKRIITKIAYEAIQEDLKSYGYRYDFPDDFRTEFVTKVNIASCYFNKKYEDLDTFIISEPCLHSLLEIVTDKNKGHVLHLLDSLSKKIEFNVEDEE